MAKRAKHKSLSSDLDRSVRWLEKFTTVKKVVLGRTESCRHRYPAGHIKLQGDSDGGIRIKGYSGNGVVDIFLVIEPQDKEEIEKSIIERFGDR